MALCAVKHSVLKAEEKAGFRLLCLRRSFNKLLGGGGSKASNEAAFVSRLAEQHPRLIGGKKAGADDATRAFFKRFQDAYARRAVLEASRAGVGGAPPVDDYAAARAENRHTATPRRKRAKASIAGAAGAAGATTLRDALSARVKIAVESLDSELLRVLLQQGADLQVAEANWRAEWASRAPVPGYGYGWGKGVKTRLKQLEKVIVDAAGATTLRDALSAKVKFAVESLDPELLRVLLQQGADLHVAEANWRAEWEVRARAHGWGKGVKTRLKKLKKVIVDARRNMMGTSGRRRHTLEQ